MGSEKGKKKGHPLLGRSSEGKQKKVRAKETSRGVGVVEEEKVQSSKKEGLDDQTANDKGMEHYSHPNTMELGQKQGGRVTSNKQGREGEPI